MTSLEQQLQASVDTPVARIDCRSEPEGDERRAVFVSGEDAPAWLTHELITALSDASVGVL